MTKGWVVAVLAVLALGTAACGDDDGGGSGSASASASASGVSACEPVGEGGGTQVAVTLDEWSVGAAPLSVPAGDVTFVAENAGEEPHELVVVEAASADELTVVDGKVDEEALPEGALVGEIEAFPAGETCDGTFELAAGEYVLFCNIAEEQEGGALESHFEEGMVTSFTVG